MIIIIISLRGTKIQEFIIEGLSKVFVIICSIRLGVFLRRYPIARVFVIVYMVSNCQQSTSYFAEHFLWSFFGRRGGVHALERCILAKHSQTSYLQALLHLWVMIVLMTYQPEIHGKDHLPDHRWPFPSLGALGFHLAGVLNEHSSFLFLGIPSAVLSSRWRDLFCTKWGILTRIYLVSQPVAVLFDTLVHDVGK